MAISLTKDTEAFLLDSLKRYVAENLDLDMGDLKTKLMLDYVLKEIGPSVYNQAIADAQATIQAKTADLGVDRYEPEFSYWKKG